MKLILIVLAWLALGCTSYDLTSPTQETLTGKWTMTAVNGEPLPYSVPRPGTLRQEFIEDILTITPPNKVTEVTTIRYTRDGKVTTETLTNSGTYEFNSYAVNFFFQDGSTSSGTLTGRTMELVTSGISFTFKKQR